MPTLVIENVPAPLYDQIHHLACAQQRTPSEIVIEVLEIAFQTMTELHSNTTLPSHIVQALEITKPFPNLRPKGDLVQAMEVSPPLPTAHDIPEEDPIPNPFSTES